MIAPAADPDHPAEGRGARRSMSLAALSLAALSLAALSLAALVL
jgi:hypothetical protein